MTVVAYDGRTLAADKQATHVGYGMTTTKVRRVKLGMAAACGDTSVARALMAWAEGGCKADAFPTNAKDSDAQLLLVTFAGKVLLYCGSVHPMEIEDRFTALGSGRDYALAAMHLGCNASEAVKVACEFDAFCGHGVTTMELP